jgi:hypothetical protein
MFLKRSFLLFAVAVVAVAGVARGQTVGASCSTTAECGLLHCVDGVCRDVTELPLSRAPRRMRSQDLFVAGIVMASVGAAGVVVASSAIAIVNANTSPSGSFDIPGAILATISANLVVAGIVLALVGRLPGPSPTATGVQWAPGTLRLTF